MDADRSERIEEVYGRALELDPARRDDFVARECASDDELRSAVEARLRHDATIDRGPGASRTLGPYRLEARLGAGGMGEVFRAVDTRLGRRVAIKLVKHEFSARFEREARAISALNHRHVCTLYDVGPNYLVMELIDGETLFDRLRRGALPFDEVLRYGAEIAEALAAAHARGIVHRDLKPGNVMLGADGVKVLDFGLAKVTTGPIAAPTETHLAMATPSYMAPEQAAGRDCTGAADLFALGLVLYEMATDALPFPGASLGSMLALGDVSVAPPYRRRGRRARRLNSLILALLEKDLGKRPGSAAQVARDLRDIGRRARWSPWLLPVGVAAPALLAAAGFWWRGTVGTNADRPLEVNRIEMVTNYPGDEITPAVSPDGSRVAFAWRGAQGTRLYVTSLRGEEQPLQLTHASGDEPSAASEDLYPAWSPDGRTIAFVRKRGATSGEVVTIPAGGGSERVLRQIRLLTLGASSWLAWSPDGGALLFSEASRETGRATLFKLRIADGRTSALLDPPEGVSGDTSPAFSPNGRSLAFTRWSSPGSASVQVQALDAEGAPNGVPVPVGTAESRSPVWLDDSHLLYVDRTQILERATVGPPRLVYVSSDRFAGLAVVHRPDGPPSLVAAQQNAAGPRLWKLPLEGAGRAGGRPELQARFGTGLSNPDFSPDGRRVTFASVRSGSPEIWVADADGANLKQLTSLGLKSTGIPRWAPDGARIAFFARMPTEPQIYVIDSNRPETGPRALTHETPGCNVPSWSRDGASLYCSRRIAGEMRLYRVKLGTDDTEPLERLFEGKDARETADGRILYLKDDRPGLFSRSLAGNPLENPEERLVDDIIGPIAYYAPTPNGIYYRAQNGFGRYAGLRFYDYARRIAIDVAPPGATGAMAALTVAPDQHELLYAQTPEPGVDLALLEFR